MSDPATDDRKGPNEELWLRLVFSILILAMLSVAQSILIALTAIQFVIMLVNNREPNERLADFGCMVGAWVMKAARYLSASTSAKPWPWQEMD